MSDIDDMDWPEIFERLTEVSERFRYGSDGASEIYDPESDRTVSFLGFDSHEISVIHGALREAIYEEGWDVCEWSNKWNITDPDQGGLKMGSAPKQSVTDYINFARAYLKAMDEKEPERPEWVRVSQDGIYKVREWRAPERPWIKFEYHEGLYAGVALYPGEWEPSQPPEFIKVIEASCSTLEEHKIYPVDHWKNGFPIIALPSGELYTVSMESYVGASPQEPQLKPCPFCGNKAKRAGDDDTGYVACQTCGARIVKGSLDEAIQAWNQRYE